MTQTQKKRRDCAQKSPPSAGGGQFSQSPQIPALAVRQPEPLVFPRDAPSSFCVEPQAKRLGLWDLDELVTEGSWARVYRARPVGAPRGQLGAYAVKTLKSEREDDPRAMTLLAREALAGRSISHPHVVAVLESHVARSPRFLVMPWLEGTTLEAHLCAAAPFDLPRLLWMARQVAEALDGLHAAGWMHGDVKPSNIHLSAEGHVTLLDLGFARRRDEADSIAERWLMGTYNYLAPEYFTTTTRPDIRSDLYSLGVVLYESLSGRLPFESDDAAELAARHKQAAPPDLRREIPHLPTGVVQLVHRLMAKEPLRRPQTPRDVVERLARLEIATFSERAA